MCEKWSRCCNQRPGDRAIRPGSHRAADAPIQEDEQMFGHPVWDEDRRRGVWVGPIRWCGSVAKDEQWWKGQRRRVLPTLAANVHPPQLPSRCAGEHQWNTIAYSASLELQSPQSPRSILIISICNALVIRSKIATAAVLVVTLIAALGTLLTSQML